MENELENELGLKMALVKQGYMGRFGFYRFAITKPLLQ